MQFGLTQFNIVEGGTGSAARELGRAAEALGYDSAWAVEHVVWPATMVSRYPYSPDGTIPAEIRQSPFPEGLVWLAHLAGATTTLRLATGILVLPQREPILLAKQVATLDCLSEGRLMLGVGVGWLREEFELLGATWERRGQRLEDYIAAIRAMWTTMPSSVTTPSVSFSDVIVAPRPFGGRPVPIIISGAMAAASRAGRIGDGYMPPPGAVGLHLRELVETMRRAAEAAERDPASIEVTAQCSADPRVIEEHAAIGVHRVLISALGPSKYDVVASTVAASLDGMSSFAQNVMPQFR